MPKINAKNPWATFYKFRSSFESYDFPKHQIKNWTPNHHGFKHFPFQNLEGHLKRIGLEFDSYTEKKDLSSKPTHQLPMAFRGVKNGDMPGMPGSTAKQFDLRKWRENPTEILGWFLMERNA